MDCMKVCIRKKQSDLHWVNIFREEGIYNAVNMIIDQSPASNLPTMRIAEKPIPWLKNEKVHVHVAILPERSMGAHAGEILVINCICQPQARNAGRYTGTSFVSQRQNFIAATLFTPRTVRLDSSIAGCRKENPPEKFPSRDAIATHAPRTPELPFHIPVSNEKSSTWLGDTVGFWLELFLR